MPAHRVRAAVYQYSRFAVRGSRLAVRGSRLAVRGSCLAVRGSRFVACGSWLAVRGSRFYLATVTWITFRNFTGTPSAMAGL